MSNDAQGQEVPPIPIQASAPPLAPPMHQSPLVPGAPISQQQSNCEPLTPILPNRRSQLSSSSLPITSLISQMPAQSIASVAFPPSEQENRDARPPQSSNLNRSKRSRTNDDITAEAPPPRKKMGRKPLPLGMRKTKPPPTDRETGFRWEIPPTSVNKWWTSRHVILASRKGSRQKTRVFKFRPVAET